jgi:hypothetical protein
MAFFINIISPFKHSLCLHSNWAATKKIDQDCVSVGMENLFEMKQTTFLTMATQLGLLRHHQRERLIWDRRYVVGKGKLKFFKREPAFPMKKVCTHVYKYVCIHRYMYKFHLGSNILPRLKDCTFVGFNVPPSPGLPDFSWYNIPKRGKYSKILQDIPHYHKIHQVATIHTKTFYFKAFPNS